MPEFTPETPTISRKFDDHVFAVPALYSKGYKLSAQEADFLNGQLATVVGNRYGAKVRAAKAKGETIADPDATFAALFTDYKVGESNRGSGVPGTGKTADPIARNIRFLAEEDLKARIITRGLKVKDFMSAAAVDASAFKSRYAELLAASIALGTNKEGTRNWREEAEAMVQRVAATTTDDSDLDLAPSEPTAAAA